MKALYYTHYTIPIHHNLPEGGAAHDILLGAFEWTAAGPKIYTDPGLTGDMLTCTVIHEWLHFLSEMLGLKLSEAQVRSVSEGLLILGKQNPALLERVINPNSVQDNGLEASQK